MLIMEQSKKLNIKQYEKESVRSSIIRALSLKPHYSNYYGQQLDEGDDYIETDCSLVLRKKEKGFYRIYIMSISQKDVVDILKKYQMLIYLIYQRKMTFQYGVICWNRLDMRIYQCMNGIIIKK